MFLLEKLTAAEADFGGLFLRRKSAGGAGRAAVCRSREISTKAFFNRLKFP